MRTIRKDYRNADRFAEDCSGRRMSEYWIAEIADGCIGCDGIATNGTCRCAPDACRWGMPQNDYCIDCNRRRQNLRWEMNMERGGTNPYA